MLENAQIIAAEPNINSRQKELDNVQQTEGNNEHQNNTVHIEEDEDTIDDEEDEDTIDDNDKKEERTDPTYKVNATIDNINKRVTRSNRDPAIPHCSLITNIK